MGASSPKVCANMFEGTARKGGRLRSHIYGAGCGAEERGAAHAGRHPNGLAGADITVGSDLLGAALGLCGPEQDWS